MATDSTHILDVRPRSGRLRPAAALIVALIAVLGLATGWGVQAARADGDPASDVLLNYPYFLPFDAGSATVAYQPRLVAVLQAAARAGFNMRVAIIAQPDDLGSVTPLWGEPVAYARFLGTELSFVYHGQVLVAMPNGLGLFTVGSLPRAEVAALAAMSAPGFGARLASAAIASVRALSAAAGHPLPATIAAAAPAAAPSSTDTGSLLAFGAGAILIAIAWTASLHARPPQARRKTTVSPVS
ncbi:MAG: hypothetical protein ACLP0J_06840 [Solirubrobacteraceae bacterium]